MLRTTIDVPMLGTLIERHGDGLLEEALMPVGWPLNLNGAVKQWCLHKDHSFKDLEKLLAEYDIVRPLMEINPKAPQMKVGAVWNKKYMEAPAGRTFKEMWHAKEKLHKHEISDSRGGQRDEEDNERRRTTRGGGEEEEQAT